jgi:hypothetical protein
VELCRPWRDFNGKKDRHRLFWGPWIPSTEVLGYCLPSLTGLNGNNSHGNGNNNGRSDRYARNYEIPPPRGRFVYCRHLEGGSE